MLELYQRVGGRLVDPRIATGLPFAAVSLCSALAALGSVVVLTRLLGAQAFGFYVTALAGVGLLQNALFFWLQTGVTRLHSRAEGDAAERALADGTELGFMLVLAFAVSGWIAVAAFSLPDLERAWLPGLVLLLARGWLSIAQAWARVRGQTWRFVVVEGVQSIGSLALTALVLAWTGADAAAALWACVAATIVAIALCGMGLRFRVRTDAAARAQLRGIWSYAAPLVVVSFAAALLTSGDRLLIVRILGPAAVASYSVGYAIAERGVTLLVAPLAIALKPAIFKAFDQEGDRAARAAIATLAVWLLGLGLPAGLFISLMAGEIARLLAPTEMAVASAAVIPWIVVGALFAALLNFYFALAFQITRKTLWLLAAIAPAAAVNMIANAVLLPRFGIAAAAWTTAGSYLLALGLAVALGRRHFAVPLPIRRMAPVLAAGAALALFLQLDFGSGGRALALAAAGGAAVYLAVLLPLSLRTVRAVPR